VEDALQDVRFADNPLVNPGPPGIRFYAGAPLTLSTGHRVGTLCLIDTQRRRFSPEERGLLEAMARTVVDLFEMRLGNLLARDNEERAIQAKR